MIKGEHYTTMAEIFCFHKPAKRVQDTEKFEAIVVMFELDQENLKRIFPGLGYGFL